MYDARKPKHKKLSIKHLYPYVQVAGESMDTFYILIQFLQCQLVPYNQKNLCQLFLGHHLFVES